MTKAKPEPIKYFTDATALEAPPEIFNEAVSREILKRRSAMDEALEGENLDTN